VYNELRYQLAVYMGAFMDEYIHIKFHSYDGYIDDVIKRLNESRF
jgi:hypothetical protein